MRPLMALGLSIDVRDSAGCTPLHAAASTGQADVLRLLAMNSASTSLVNHAGQNAQHCAQVSPKNTLVCTHVYRIVEVL